MRLTLVLFLTFFSFIFSQNRIETFNNTISLINKNNISSLDNISAQFALIFKDGTITEKDSAIILFWDFYNRMANEQSTVLNNKKLPDYYSAFINIADYPSEKTEQLLAKKGFKYSQTDLDYLAQLNKFGFKIVNEEGMYYVKIGSTRFFEQKFKPQLSENTFNYFIKLIEAESNPFAYDGAIVKDLNSIADNLIWWEKFLNNNTLSYYQDNGKHYYNILLLTLLEGHDNSPAFDYSSKKLSKKFSKCYEYIIKKYDGTKSADIFKKYVKLLKKSNNKKTKQIEEFIGQFQE